MLGILIAYSSFSIMGCPGYHNRRLWSITALKAPDLCGGTSVHVSPAAHKEISSQPVGFFFCLGFGVHGLGFRTQGLQAEGPLRPEVLLM